MLGRVNELLAACLLVFCAGRTDGKYDTQGYRRCLVGCQNQFIMYNLQWIVGQDSFTAAIVGVKTHSSLY